MILVDTSVWIDHYKGVDTRLPSLLARREVLMHDFVIGELAVGSLRDRETVLRALLRLPRAPPVSISETLDLLQRESLFSSGLGFVDVSLLASTLAAPGTLLWASDVRLHDRAEQLNVAFPK